MTGTLLRSSPVALDALANTVLKVCIDDSWPDLSANWSFIAKLVFRLRELISCLCFIQTSQQPRGLQYKADSQGSSGVWVSSLNLNLSLQACTSHICLIYYYSLYQINFGVLPKEHPVSRDPLANQTTQDLVLRPLTSFGHFWERGGVWRRVERGLAGCWKTLLDFILLSSKGSMAREKRKECTRPRGREGEGNGTANVNQMSYSTRKHVSFHICKKIDGSPGLRFQKSTPSLNPIYQSQGRHFLLGHK